MVDNKLYFCTSKALFFYCLMTTHHMTNNLTISLYQQKEILGAGHVQFKSSKLPSATIGKRSNFQSNPFADRTGSKNWAELFIWNFENFKSTERWAWLLILSSPNKLWFPLIPSKGKSLTLRFVACYIIRNFKSLAIKKVS